MLAIALCLLIGMSLPGVTSDPGDSVMTKERRGVAIQGHPSVLAEIAGSHGFEADYIWYEIGWIGGKVDLATYLQLKLRPDVFVEDEVLWHLQCHGGPPPHEGCGGGGGGRTTPDDQTPYGIEQIYNSGSISATSGGAGVTLGHIDTGIDQDHPDLVNRIVFADADDKNGHGTHTAGTAAADAGSDGLGIYGVAPGASIRSYKVCSNFCNTNTINAAIQDCTANGRQCDVITFSIGGDGESTSTRDAINAFVGAGGIFIAAAGNDGPSLGSIDWPAANPNAVAVAAIDSTKTVASFSSRGVNDGDGVIESREVELAAAGVSVESTYKGGGYAYISGTSMATPHVAGLALKKWTGDGASTRLALRSGVEDITKGQSAGTGDDAASGFGLPHV